MLMIYHPIDVFDNTGLEQTFEVICPVVHV